MASGVTGFVFASQLVNYPAAPGSSGHLIGAALATAVLGPWLAIVSLSVVLTMQAFVFADGGVASLGVNVLLMAVVPVAVSWAVLELAGARRRGRVGATTAAAVAGALSVPTAAVVLTGLYVIGGVQPVSAGELLAGMTSVHAVIGVGEAIATGAVVAIVLAARPGRAYLDGRPTRGVAGAGPTVGIGWVSGALALIIVAVFASRAPDGLETVALRLGFNDAGASFVWSPLADYGGAAGLTPIIAGVIGVALCTAACWAGLRLLAAHAGEGLTMARLASARAPGV